MRWLNELEVEEIFVTAISKAEILFRIECMPAGKKRPHLVDIHASLFNIRFAGRVLPFDEDCATVFARFATLAWKRGLTMGTPDLQIASIAAYNHFAVATRNVGDFDHENLNVINPWTD